MKIKLELNVLDDGRIFLNFWENIHGKDVVCEVKKGTLFMEDDAGKTWKLPIVKFIDKVITNAKAAQP